MNKLISVVAAWSILGAASVSGQTFDQKVSEARRHMRASCQAVQKVVKAPAPEGQTLKNSAAAEASEALRLWSDLAKEYAPSVPEGYAGDPAWAQRLEDIRLNIERMGKEISESQWRPAFLSCAHACSLLAAMHEANGVTLAIDAMTVLRKKVGFARGLLAAGKPALTRLLVKDILAGRDGVLLAPLPDTAQRGAFEAALPELSIMIDDLAKAARGGGDLKAPLDRLAPLVERVYELAI